MAKAAPRAAGVGSAVAPVGVGRVDDATAGGTEEAEADGGAGSAGLVAAGRACARG